MEKFCLRAFSGISSPLLLCRVLTVLLAPVADKNSLGVTFVNVAGKAGITTKTIYGDEHKNRYLLETTGSGAAFIDYHNDGWEDIFLDNGTRLDGVEGDRRFSEKKRKQKVNPKKSQRVFTLFPPPTEAPSRCVGQVRRAQELFLPD